MKLIKSKFNVKHFFFYVGTITPNLLKTSSKLKLQPVLSKYEFVLQHKYIFSIIYISYHFNQKQGLFLNKLILIICLTLFIFSCHSNQENELIKEILTIEFQRSSDPGVFEKFAGNENVKIRILTADAIAKIGNPTHLPILLRLLEDKNSAVVKKAIFAIGQIGGQDSLLLSLLKDEQFDLYKRQIITGLGMTRNDIVLSILLSNLESYPDSIKTTALQAITFIAPENFTNYKIKNYLADSNLSLSGTAAYYFSRHPQASAVSSLIRANIQPGTLWDKYRLKALQRSLRGSNLPNADSTLFDSLKYRISSDLKKNLDSWQHRFYELSILQHYQDSTSYKLIADYLTNANHFLRYSAINAIVKFDTIDATSTLFQVYQGADWMDKGFIIMALAKKNPEMVYNLIQQNLDKGNTYFKQLLLQSLAIIRNDMSIRQLRQFLLVPNIQLKLTAFEELSKFGYIGYRQVKDFLLSGDIALTIRAAQSIISHPDWAQFDDLNAAYAMYTEPQGVETMLSLLAVMDLLPAQETIQFFKNVYQNTSSYILARKAQSSLKKLNVILPVRAELHINLHVPEKLFFQDDKIRAIIETSKGDVIIELWPQIAPATVSNFMELVQKKFYDNLVFHRVVPDFVIQGGDPRGDGWGGPGYTIPCEYNQKHFERGTIGMAISGKDTGGSQFFICLSEQPHLNRHYTAFGKVVSGLDVIDNIEIGDIINQIVIEK